MSLNQKRQRDLSTNIPNSDIDNPLKKQKIQSIEKDGPEYLKEYAKLIKATFSKKDDKTKTQQPDIKTNNTNHIPIINPINNLPQPNRYRNIFFSYSFHSPYSSTPSNLCSNS